VRRVVNNRLHILRKFLVFGAVPSVENQEEFTQSTEGRLVERGVFSEWSSQGKGFKVLGGVCWREKDWHRRASL
jgi:hypothetical protein